jgi:ferredoxin
MKVYVDLEVCEAHGECVFASPEVFELDATDTLHWDQEPDDGLRDSVEEAARACPVQAITVSPLTAEGD